MKKSLKDFQNRFHKILFTPQLCSFHKNRIKNFLTCAIVLITFDSYFLNALQYPLLFSITSITAEYDASKSAFNGFDPDDIVSIKKGYLKQKDVWNSC